MKQEGEKMLTLQDIMDFLQVSRATVYRLIDQKAFPVYKVGLRGIRVKREDLEKYIEEGKKE